MRAPSRCSRRSSVSSASPRSGRWAAPTLREWTTPPEGDLANGGGKKAGGDEARRVSGRFSELREEVPDPFGREVRDHVAAVELAPVHGVARVAALVRNPARRP